MEQSHDGHHRHRIIGVRPDGSRLVIIQGVEREVAESLQKDMMELDSDFLWFEVEAEHL